MAFLIHFPDYVPLNCLVDSFIAYLDGKQITAKREVIVLNRRDMYVYIVFLKSQMFRNRRKSGWGCCSVGELVESQSY